MAKINEVTVTANKVYKKKLFARLSKVIFLLLFVIVTFTYFILYLIYSGGGFSIRIDKDLNSSSIFLTTDENGSIENEKTRYLKSESVEYMDNISVNWISQNIDSEAMGSHNGENYYAYTFYLVNDGKNKINYWYQITMEDSMLDLDEAIRVMVYRNGERTIYAKKNSTTGEAEEGTKIFFNDTIPVLEERKDFKPKDRDKFTIVVWIEGDDPDCNNALLGGGIKMNMKITEERLVR